MNKLTPSDAIDYANNTKHPSLVSPNHDEFEVFEVSYAKSVYLFYLDYLQGFVTIDTRVEHFDVFEENGVIHFQADGEKWKLKDAGFKYYLDSLNQEIEPDEEQICACVKRDAEIDSYTNQFLKVCEDSRAKVQVRFRAELDIDTEDYLQYEHPFRSYSCYFEASVVDSADDAMLRGASVEHNRSRSP